MDTCAWPDWAGLTVECRFCHHVFTLGEDSWIDALLGSRVRNRTSIGIVCPRCHERLVVHYDRRWRSTPTAQPEVLTSL
jgi:uncharacterized protein YlaI